MSGAYRPCVGLMLINAHNQVFVGQRLDSSVEAWQMPQGGIDPGEAPYQAALRELGEETGLHESDIELVAEAEEWFRYDLPTELRAKLWDGRYIGQEQKWFLLRLVSDDDAINIATEIPEFRAWQWLEPERLHDVIVPFKRDVYTQVLQEFAKHLSGVSKSQL